MKAMRARPDAAFIECQGLAYDDTDPLWDEAAFALRGNDLDIGDADLTSTSRERLEKAGQYIIVSQDTSDEWIYVSGMALRDGLQAVQEKLAGARRDWINDDLHEARVLWDDLVKVLERRRRLAATSSNKVKDHDGVTGPLIDLEAADEKGLNAGAERIQQLLDRARSAWSSGVESSDLLASLEAVRASAEDLHDLFCDIQVERAGRAPPPAAVIQACNREEPIAKTLLANNLLDDEIRLGSSYAWSQLDVSDAHSFKFTEFLRCLDRCVFACQSSTSSTGRGNVASRAPLQLEVGSDVEVSGLTAPAEKSLNGQIASVVAWHQSEGLWQVRLQASGTRLLLSADHFTPVLASEAATRQKVSKAPEVQHRRRRSRSPRRSMHARSLSELAEVAAARGEYILIHHTVAWSD